ncbi:MAG: PEP-CTERM sorting domain-containing protein [Tepidisphaeraceae bacterium]
MKVVGKSLILGAALAAVAGTSAVSQAAISVTLIPALNNYATPNQTAGGINNNGLIVGSSRYGGTSATYTNAYTYDLTTGTLTALPQPSNATISMATGMGLNNSGQVAGNFYVNSSTFHAYSYSGGTATDLGTLIPAATGVAAFATTVNDSGVVGGYGTAATSVSAFTATVTGGVATLTNYGTIGGTATFVYGINNSGKIVGYGTTAVAGVSHAFVSDPATQTLVDLGTLGGLTSQANSINDAGQIVGSSRTADSGTNSHAALYSGGVWTDLGLLSGGTTSLAYDINNNGQIVGAAATSGTATNHAVLYQTVDLGNGLAAGQLIDLNTLIDPASGWVLTSATSINDSGWVIGVGSYGGQTRAYALQIPEPASLAGLAVVAGALLRRRKSRA